MSRTTTAKRRLTPKYAATMLRSRIVRKLKAMAKDAKCGTNSWAAGYRRAIEDMQEWVRGTDNRAAKKPGGI